MPRIFLLLSLFLSSILAPAQYTARKIVFSDPGPYAQQDLEAVAGIHAGQAFTTADLAAAAQHLSDTACFDTIDATLNGPVKAANVLFTIKPMPQSQMLRAGFQNLVWLTPAELTAAIHAKVPLYLGYVPEAGSMSDAVNDAIQQALAAKGVTAVIAHSTIEPSTGHPGRTVAYAAVRPLVLLGSVTLTGIAPGMQAAMQKQSTLLTGKPYNEGLAGLTTADALLAPYRDAGYIGATITGLERTPSEASGRIQVALTGTVDAGPIYQVSSITYAGSAEYSVATFTQNLKLHPEDPASGKALRDTLAPIATAYRNHGYMDVVANVVPTLDTATHHVAYTVVVTRGEQYRLGAVHTVNLDPATQGEFDRSFQLKPGDIYNPGYVGTFLLTANDLHALAAYSAAFKASADPQTHLVDLTITFIRARR